MAHPLRIYREKQTPPMSQDALGTLLGVTRATINRWETGYRAIGLNYLSDVSRKTGIPMRDLRPDLAEKFEAAEYRKLIAVVTE